MKRRLDERRRLVQKMTLPSRDDWTLEEIQNYTGSDPDLPILTAIDGFVYNVWRGSEWYGPEGPYHSIAGRDSTRFLAKQILEEEEDDGQPLDAMEIDALNGWKEHFNFKYDNIGKLKASSGDVPELAKSPIAPSSVGTTSAVPASNGSAIPESKLVASFVQLAECREDAATIRKAMKAVVEGGADDKGNQVRRWVLHKEAHCSSLIARVQEMLLALDVSTPKYTEQLVGLHSVVVAAMKCKQTVDVEAVDALGKAIDALGS